MCYKRIDYGNCIKKNYQYTEIINETSINTPDGICTHADTPRKCAGTHGVSRIAKCKRWISPDTVRLSYETAMRELPDF